MSGLRSALRQLTARAGLSAVVVLMLALGLGATAVFSVFYEVAQRPLPVADPQPLVNLGAPGEKWGSVGCGMAGDCDQIFSYPMFRDLEARQTAFAGIAGHSIFDANLSFRGVTLPGEGALVSGEYFSLLGVRPAVGRVLTLGQSTLRSGDSTRVMLFLVGVTALVLLIACVNIANLLLARGAARAGEMAVRAAIGVYGLLAYNVQQRTRELGLRQALGATAGALRRIVVRQVAGIASVGLLVGLAGAIGFERAAGVFVYGVEGYDPVVLAGAAAGICAVVSLAAYLPARCAASVAPMEALRYE